MRHRGLPDNTPAQQNTVPLHASLL